MKDKPGINVIGHVAGNLGVGVATRQIIGLIESRGYPVAAFDVDLGTRRKRTELRYEHLTCKTAEELPHRINLFVLGLGAIDWTLTKCPEHFFDGSYLNAIVCFWELPVVSAARLAQLDGFDVVIGASDFLRHVFQQSLSRATILGGLLPISLPPPVPFDRGRIGIPADATVFGFSFDPASDPERKNPDAIVAAFLQGVARQEDAWLVVRVNNAVRLDGTTSPVLTHLQQSAADHPRIVFVTEPMSYPEVLGLYHACDAYVSLHRAEGLGLGMAEAMTLGIPVIATGWSGNMTFMRQTNACLVDYRLVPVRGSLPVYQEREMVGGASWAEAEVDHAAAFMTHLAADRGSRVALGRAAAEAMKAFNRAAYEGHFLDELVAIHRNRELLRSVGYASARRAAGRPVLRMPTVPWSETSSTAIRSFGRRVAGKLRKVARLDRRSAGMPRRR